MKTSKKSRTITLVLSALLGTYGAHRFYTKKKYAVLMLVTSLLFIGLLVNPIVNLIDFILILSGKFKDGEGNLITKWDHE